ncbi:MAG: adenine-specific methylase, partial [Armatimonadetes bacterium]|nr:adenine-specific methylase [Armatimonadota bacterium]
RLLRFYPGLPISPKPAAPALQERAERSGFDFLDYWAVDFEYEPGTPFAHRWRCARRPGKRKLPVCSGTWQPAERVGASVAVKVVDVFGYETLALAERARTA